MNWRAGVKIGLPLAVAALCLFEFIMHRQSEIFRGYAAAVVSLQGILLLCLAVWCGMFLFLNFAGQDWLLVVLLLLAGGWYFFGATHFGTDPLALVFGVTLGKGVRFFLQGSSRRKEAPFETGEQSRSLLTSAATFLIGLVVLLAFASWWHLDMAYNYYHGPRWMGLWDNPNIYGMLMGAGTLLAIGLLAASLKAKNRSLKSKVQSPKSAAAASADFAEGRRFFPFFFLRESAESADKKDWRSLSLKILLFTAAAKAKAESGKRKAEKSGFLRSLRSLAAILKAKTIFLWIAVFMLGTGLVMSYSRGAWLGAAAGLAYLAWSYGKLKWRYVILGAGVLALASGMFWGRTPDSSPWFVKRADLGRASAQNRVTAWRAGLEMMRDHPWGVGWNNAVKLYGKKYDPPAGGPGALTTNSYLMLGTELGIPALVCFVGYIGMCFRSPKLTVQSPRSKVQSLKLENDPALDFGHGTLDLGLQPLDAAQAACRAGALVLVVAFWFDGGLFTLPTAAVFWVLLELGRTGEEARS